MKESSFYKDMQIDRDIQEHPPNPHNDHGSSACSYLKSVISFDRSFIFPYRNYDYLLSL